MREDPLTTPDTEPDAESAGDSTVPAAQRIETGIDLPIATVLVALAGLAFGFWAMTSWSEPPTVLMQAPPSAPAPVSAPVPPTAPQTAEQYLDLSLSLYRAKQFEASLAAARQAIKLRADYAEAWNNAAASSAELARWDEAIQAASEAIRLKPDFQLAKNNLAWARSQAALQKK